MGYDEDNDDTTPTTALRKWADEAMFTAEGHESTEGRGVLPSVHLLWMTPDPLGAVAAMSEMYKGNVIRDMNDLTDDQRRSAWADVQQTHLQAPLEAIKLHFLIDGVDRAFTHQIVRQRTAVYAQESMRFAVVDDLKAGTTLPPSLSYDPEKPEDDGTVLRATWFTALDQISKAYQYLVDNGVPAEDARGLLPHATATRLNYITDMRNLADHAGNRLCTQAQFHWRIVFSLIVQQIRNYVPAEIRALDEHVDASDYWDELYGWQFHDIAESALFRPVCYHLNRCPFHASFDRACSIRERVDAFAKEGVPSSEWGEGIGRPNYHESGVQTIRNEEWLLNPKAARVKYGS